MEDSSDERGVRKLVRRAIDTALLPFYVATSKPAQRAYLGTLLFTTTSLFLLFISSIAYALFYYNYIPQIGVERVIHLQFGDGHPHGSADLSTSLISLQAYDVSVSLHLPRTPSNLAAGNFMLDVTLLAPTKSSSTPSSPISALTLPNTSVVAHSRRPGILTYISPLVDTASTLSGMPLYVLGWKRESEILKIPIFEGVEFAKGWTNIPRYVRVTIEADEKMQVYDVGVRFIARFAGLRWVIYHHRILSYMFFTMAFWTSSMVSCAVAWILISMFWVGRKGDVKEEKKEDKGKKIKTEADEDGELDPTSMEDLSDTSRTFPTLGRQMPLHFSGRKERVKQEDDELKAREDRVVASTSIQPLGAEADDEEDEDEAIVSWRDSGIGTSLEDTDRRRSIQRRRRSLFGGDK